MSKMGISTLRSYHAAQQFEAVGLNREVVDEYFTGTASRIGGVGLDVIAREALARHRAGLRAAPAGRAGTGFRRRVPLPPRRRDAPLEPDDDHQAPARGDAQRPEALRRVRPGGQRPEPRAAARSAGCSSSCRASRCRSRKSSRPARSSSGSTPGPCRTARSARRPTRRWPSP